MWCQINASSGPSWRCNLENGLPYLEWSKREGKRMIISVEKMDETGFGSALVGLSLNKEQKIDNMLALAGKLAQATEGSHRKFLRHIQTWWLIEAPRYWWTEFDTYKVGVVRNSGSTMHNLHKEPPVFSDFVDGTPPTAVNMFQKVWTEWKSGALTLEQVKAALPEGYLQKSVITMNYENIRTIIRDRHNHRLPAWKMFCEQVFSQVNHPNLLSVK
jgi:hypothetical protein